MAPQTDHGSSATWRPALTFDVCFTLPQRHPERCTKRQRRPNCPRFGRHLLWTAGRLRSDSGKHDVHPKLGELELEILRKLLNGETVTVPSSQRVRRDGRGR